MQEEEREKEERNLQLLKQLSGDLKHGKEEVQVELQHVNLGEDKEDQELTQGQREEEEELL